VAAAAENLVLILVDVTERGSHKAETEKYGVSGLPALFKLDPDGKVVGELQASSPQGVAKEFRELYEQHGRKVPWAKSVDDGLKTAAEQKKPVLLFLADQGAESKQVESLFYAKSMMTLGERFVLIRHEVGKKCETCKRFRATKGGKIQILDPTAEDPAKKPLVRISGKKKVADLKKALDSAHKRWVKAQEKAAEK
jgi:hypothetical protein